MLRDRTSSTCFNDVAGKFSSINETNGLEIVLNQVMADALRNQTDWAGVTENTIRRCKMGGLLIIGSHLR